MKLTVDKGTFVKNYLKPISALVSDGMVYFEHDAATKSLVAMCQHTNQTLACCARYFYKSFEDPADFGLRDLQRLIKAVEFVDKETDDLTLQFENGIAFYEDKLVRFEMSVMDEAIARQFRPGLKPSQFDQFEFQIEFGLTHDAVDRLVKARQFAQDADALEISQDSQGQVFGELYKHKAPKCDRIKLPMSLQSSGQFKKSWSVPLDIVSVIGGLGCDVQVLSKFDRGNFLLSAQLQHSSLKYGQVPIT